MFDMSKLYRDHYIRKTPLFTQEAQTFLLFRTHPQVNGSFTAFKTIADFRKQIMALLLIPIICLKQIIELLINATIHIIETAINIAFLRGEAAISTFRKACTDLFFAIGYTIRAIFDTITAALSLITRSGTTVVSAFISSLKFIGNCCNPADNISEDNHDIETPNP